MIKGERMKLLFFIFTVIFTSTLCHSYEIKVGTAVIFNKYEIGGVPVWDDKEKDSIINNCVDTGTGCPKAGDFELVSISTREQAVINEIWNEGKISTRTRLKNEITNRKSSSYNLEKTMEYQTNLDVYLKLKSSYGLSTDAVQSDVQEDLNKFKDRVINPIP